MQERVKPKKGTESFSLFPFPSCKISSSHIPQGRPDTQVSGNLHLSCYIRLTVANSNMAPPSQRKKPCTVAISLGSSSNSLIT